MDSSLIAAIAQIVMAMAVTYQAYLTKRSLDAMRSQWKLSIMKEHTTKLKDIVTEFLLQVGQISKAKKSYGPRPKAFDSVWVGGRKNKPYAGQDLLIEASESHLFNDLIENHDFIYENGQKKKLHLKKHYQEFKECAKKLNEKTNELEAKVSEFLKGRTDVVPKCKIQELINSGKVVNGLFEEESMKEFLLEALISGKDELVFGSTLELTKGQFEFSFGLQYGSYYGKYFDTKTAKEEVNKKVKEMLNEARNRFEKDIRTIHELVENFNKHKEHLEDSLSRLKDMRGLYDEECDCVKFAI